MKLDFDEKVKLEDIDAKKAAEDAVSAVLQSEDIPCDDIGVSLTVTDADTVRSLNKEHRGIDDTTDVLSFPMYELDAGEYDGLYEELTQIKSVGGTLLLGDIVLNAGRVASQAKDYGHSVLREYSFLIVHSMLHLLGYDHMTDDDRTVMEEKQRIIMDALGITRNI